MFGLIRDKYRAWRAAARADALEAEASVALAERAFNDWRRVMEAWSDYEDDDDRDWGSTRSKSMLPWRGPAKSLEMARAKSRDLFLLDETYLGLINCIIDLSLQDSGLTTTFQHDDQQLAETAQQLWDEWSDETLWVDRIDEAFERVLVDGEMLMRWFWDGVDLKQRFVDPEKLKAPRQGVDPIETDPEDVETILRFNIEYGNEIVPVDATACTWWKIGTQSNVKRGLPLLFASSDTVKSYGQWLYDLLLLVRMRTAIVMIRKHLGATPGQVRTFADAQKTGTTNETASGSKRSVRRRRYRGGTIIDTNNTDYEYLSPNVDAKDLVNVGRELGLRLSQGSRMAEYLSRMDAQSATYAGVMISQTASQVSIRRWQRRLAERVQRPAMRQVLMSRVELLGGPERVKELVRKAKIIGPRFPRGERLPDVKGDSIAVSGGWMSKRTAAIRDGLDPDVENSNMADEEERRSYPEWGQGDGDRGGDGDQGPPDRADDSRDTPPQSGDRNGDDRED